MKRKKPKQAPRSPDELLTLAAQHAERGEHAEAEARYREVLALDPDHLGALTLLGLLLVEREDFERAIDLLERARDAAPNFAQIQVALGSAYAAAGHDEQAVAAMEIAVKLDTDSTIPLERLAKHHLIAGRNREATVIMRRILRRNPSHAHAKYFLTALAAETPEALATYEGPPPELVADLFDTYAPMFDQHLVEGLNYVVPRSLKEQIISVAAPTERCWRVVDLGCGTGLMGIEIRPYAHTLIGSDLSAKMVERARQRAIYDELHVEDLAATLARTRDADLIVAADVFLYIGELDATIAGCAAALRPNGLLAFSVERSDDANVVLRPSIRFAHGDTYIRDLATKHRFTIERAEPSVLRIENGQPMNGTLYVFRAPV